MKPHYLLLAALPLLPYVSAPLRAVEPSDVTITVAHDTLDFKAGKDLVTRYHVGADIAKPYLWPLNGPTGKPLTRAWPMEKTSADEKQDHPHQKSAWFCHGDVIPEGYTFRPGEKSNGTVGVDFWSEEAGHGVITCVHVAEPKADKNHAQVRTLNEWRTALGNKLLDETRTIHLYDFGDTRLFVFDIDLEASVYPITFGDTKEGSFGVRVADVLREEITVDGKKVPGKGKMQNADGKVGEKDCWGYPSAWCDYSGPLDGQKVGLAILAATSNPTPSVWHTRGYGLMAANPFGREKSGFPSMKGKTELVHLAKGEHLKLRYGILIHPGDAFDGNVADYFDRFVKLK